MKQEHEYQLVIDTTSSGFVLTDEEYCVILYNPFSLPFIRRTVIIRHNEWEIARELGLDYRRAHRATMHESNATTFPSCNCFEANQLSVLKQKRTCINGDPPFLTE